MNFMMMMTMTMIHTVMSLYCLLLNIALYVLLQCAKTCKGGIMTRILSYKKRNSEGEFIPEKKVACQSAVMPPVTAGCNDDIPCSGKHPWKLEITCFSTSPL